jgi:hypothetical protein
MSREPRPIMSVRLDRPGKCRGNPRSTCQHSPSRIYLWPPAVDHILGSVGRQGRSSTDGLPSGEPAGAGFVTTPECISHVDGATFLPRPVRRPRIPIWSGCTWGHRRPLLPATRWLGQILLKMHNDVLVPMAMEVAEVAAQIRHVNHPADRTQVRWRQAEPDAILSR